VKVVCIDNSLFPGELETGMVYEAEFVFFDVDDDMAATQTVVKWEKNYLAIKGFNELDWYPTSIFMRMEEYREKQLGNLGI
jgi:hypothetical protein